jgi:hypothetical protein
MGTRKLIAVSALAALGLAACNGKGEGARAGGAGSRLCTPFPDAAAAQNTADASAALDDCLHRWGYSLAASSDLAEAAAQATVAACTPALTRWNQQALTPTAPGAPTADVSAPSLVTGQPTTPIAEHYSYAQNRALFYVVQARAGKCAPPPAPAQSSPSANPPR